MVNPIYIPSWADRPRQSQDFAGNSAGNPLFGPEQIANRAGDCAMMPFLGWSWLFQGWLAINLARILYMIRDDGCHGQNYICAYTYIIYICVCVWTGSVCWHIAVPLTLHIQYVCVCIYIYYTLWIQTLFEKLLDPLNHTPSTSWEGSRDNWNVSFDVV